MSNMTSQNVTAIPTQTTEIRSMSWKAPVIWSYAATTGCPRAIHLGYGQREAQLFCQRLIRYGGSADHPLFPGFVEAVDLALDSPGNLRVQEAALVRLESTTGYRPKGQFYSTTADTGKNLKGLGELSKDAAIISNMIGFQWLDINISKQFLELLAKYSSHPLATQPALWKEVADVACFLLQKIECRELFDMVMTKRVENQMTIIFNLIAREDTAATIRLAEAAKRDTSSMKTLAVMTMAFLPATFLATVFAMPSLALDQPPGFNVYLAVSRSQPLLPSCLDGLLSRNVKLYETYY